MKNVLVPYNMYRKLILRHPGTKQLQNQNEASRALDIDTTPGLFG
jgi:hypothetical protein